MLLKRGEYNYTPHPEMINVSHFVKTIIDDLSLVAIDEVSIKYETSDGEAHGQFDTTLLRQITMNLVSNALKYSNPEGEVRVYCEIKDNGLVLTVEDDGIGIPEGDQQRIFELFYRATNVVQTPGNGIGLAIVRQAAQTHGGSITFESRVDVGSKFIVEIPALG